MTAGQFSIRTNLDACAMNEPEPSNRDRRRVGVVLGGGAARGWAHVGVLRELERAGFRPDLVCGTSIGALVGAAYAAGGLDRFETWVRGMRVSDVVAFLDVTLSSGLVKGERLVQFLRRELADRPIESLPLPFAAVATVLATGAEVWLRDGSTVEAVRASIALPGLLTPVQRDGELLVDGGLVNPVPVSLARAMGADVVIAVDLNSDLLGRHLRAPPEAENREAASGPPELLRRLQDHLGSLLPGRANGAAPAPSLLEVVASSLNIMQVRITRSRMAGDPPDVLVTPRLAHLSLLDFHRGKEAIEEGRRAVAAALPQLDALGLRTR
jgi:NTE family protein